MIRARAKSIPLRQSMSMPSLPDAKEKRRPPRRYIVSATAIFFFLQIILSPFVQLNDVGDLVDEKLNLKQNAKEDKFLSQFASEFNDFYREANKNISISYRQLQCEKDTTALLLEEWKQNRRKLICETNSSVSSASEDGQKTTAVYNDAGEFVVQEYVLSRWTERPKIFRYQNVKAWSMEGPIRTKCRPTNTSSVQPNQNVFEDSKRRIAENENKRFDTISVDATVIRVRLFDAHNVYESFHAYVNVAMIMIMFDIRDPQLILIVNSVSERDTHMWRLFSTLEPIILNGTATEGKSLRKIRYHFRDIIEAPDSHLSMINTRSESGGLQGRATNHECRSPILLAIIGWMKWRLNSMDNRVMSSIESHVSSQPIQIIWSSRQPYCCRDNETFTPKRIIENETEWIKLLGNLLGDGYKIKNVDFGTLSLSESIQVVEEADIMVGMHGAGLTWSAFLPFAKSGKPSNITGKQKGLVEIFAGDRNQVNRHYHNIASLVGIQYRETEYWSSSDKIIRWNEKRLNEVASQIRSIDI